MLELVKYARTFRGRIVSARLEKACADPVKSQLSFLRHLVRRNADTLFGRAHSFKSIRTEEDFKRHVPLRDYEDFRPLINRITAGERRVLTAEEPFMLTMTSGTTSKPKYIPVTRSLQTETARLMSAWLYKAEQDHAGLLDYAAVGIVSRAVEGRTKSAIPYGSASGLIYKNIPWLVRRAYAIPYPVSELDDYDERYLVAARFALSRRVSFIATPNAATLLRLAEVTVANQERIVRAVRDGALAVEAVRHREVYERLRSMLRPDAERACELERVIKTKGFLRMADCWPDLRLIGCWTGGSAGLKVKRLAAIYGDVPVRDLGYIASEGRVTVPIEDETAAGVPALTSGYYEFIPEEESDTEKASVLSINELEEGRRYGIILTTAGGLYRYRIDDIVEVAGFHNRAPLLSFVRKGGEAANITGEKMHVNHIIEAIKTVARSLHLRLEQFRAAPDYVSSRYEIFLEFEQPPAPGLLHNELLPAIDEALARVNLEYEQKRRSKRLALPCLHLMARGWASREMRRHMEQGRRDTQYKWQILLRERREEDVKEIVCTIEDAGPTASSAPAFAA